MKLAALFLITFGTLLASAQNCCSHFERQENGDGLGPMWPYRPELDCSSERIDAATTTLDRKTYFFKGGWYWKMNDRKVARGYPRLITQDWDGLPGHLDAAFTWSDGRTFFFKGDVYWSFHDRRMDKGYPRKITDGFPRIPGNLDAAVLYEPSDYVYFFKGSQYWRLDAGAPCNPTHRGYPMLVSDWTNVPDDIDDVLYEEGFMYFFKNGSYYKYTKNQRGEEPGDEPRPILENWGFNCEQLKCRIQPV